MKRPFYNIFKPFVVWYDDHINLDSCCEDSKRREVFIRYSWGGGRCEACNKLVVSSKDLPFLKWIKLAIFH